MNRKLSLGVIGLLTTATLAFGATDQVRPADPQDTQLPAPAPNQSTIPRSPRKSFARVFPAPDIAEQQRLRAKLAEELLRADRSDIEVICGLTIRHVDERIDPRIIVPHNDQAVDAKIKRIAPQVCRSDNDTK
ncbi:MAG: hypothetical protein DMF84_15275 [Acidobacteria bacterium]|nr:MAG: hypothetical protein DMF84_15275 [Acidobacteriota bacterium]